jgi:hypothetical protein
VGQEESLAHIDSLKLRLGYGRSDIWQPLSAQNLGAGDLTEISSYRVTITVPAMSCPPLLP